MRNKKGFFLAEETIKMVLALIVLGFLSYFLTSIYMNNKNSQDKEFAIATLDNLLVEVGSKSVSYEILNPEDWFLINWPTEYTEGWGPWANEINGLPLACENVGWTSCICFCLEVDPNECDEDGYCLNNDKGISIEGNVIEIEEVPLNLNLEYSDVGVVIRK
jgi:hypothetical protein